MASLTKRHLAVLTTNAALCLIAIALSWPISPARLGDRLDWLPWILAAGASIVGTLQGQKERKSAGIQVVFAAVAVTFLIAAAALHNWVLTTTKVLTGIRGVSAGVMELISISVIFGALSLLATIVEWAALSTIFGTSSPTPSQAEDAHEETLNKVGESTDPRFNIVFVHGIAGDHQTTWQAGDNEAAYWPAWVAQDFPNAQVYALHYNAAPSLWLGPTMPLIPRGENLLNLFNAEGIFRLPSVFIVHSFGGLVLKALWRSAKDQEHKEALESIKAIIFLATPHHGSLLTYLDSFLKAVGRTTQTVKDLKHHDQLLLNLDQFYRTHPVPMNFVYYETQPTTIGPLTVKVVDEASASLMLPQGKVFPVPLMANHQTICKPSSREHDIAVRIESNLREIASALFEPQPRPDRFEIDSYEITLAPEPLEMQDFQFGEGNRRRTVPCDNKATLDEFVTFGPNNQLRSPFTLRYYTKNDGFIKFTPSHTNEASAEEQARCTDYGLDAIFTFTPKAGETYHLWMEIFKGFDEGSRCMARRLVKPAHYRRVILTLNLEKYIDKDYTVREAPQLYRHYNYGMSASSRPIGELLQPKVSGPKEWIWHLDDVDEGVLNLIWDITSPSGASTKTTHFVASSDRDEIIAQYEEALREFKVLQRTLDDISRLHDEQIAQYFRDTGVTGCFDSEFAGTDKSRLRFLCPLGRFSKPFEGGVGAQKPLGPFHEYLVTMEFGETLDVYRIDIESLRIALRSFRQEHPDIHMVHKVFMSPCFITETDKQMKEDDFYYIPAEGFIEMGIQINEDEILPLVANGQRLRIPYSSVDRLKPASAIKLAKERQLIIKMPDGDTEALPALRKVWDLVENMDRRLIESFLQRRIHESRA